MFQIVIHNQPFNYSISRKPIRSLRLRLTSATSFSVSAPILTPNFIITQFIQANAGWIIKNSQKYSPAPVSVFDLTKLSILGIEYQLIIKDTSRDSVVIFDDTNQIFINTSSQSESHLKAILDHKLRTLALKLINRQLTEFASQYHFEYHHVSVRSQSSRFGSCSSTGNLNFNWQIILFPPEIFNHILLHELTHLNIRNHSQKFWQQLAVYDHHCGQHRLWLKKEANRYLLIKK